jgi:hypothetical protein
MVEITISKEDAPSITSNRGVPLNAQNLAQREPSAKGPSDSSYVHRALKIRICSLSAKCLVRFIRWVPE